VARSSTFSDGEPQNAAALGQGHPERARHPIGSGGEGLDGGVSADAPELVAHDRPVFEPVTVGVDDRVIQASAEFSGLSRSVGSHRRTPAGA